jgi:hypothetical protein
VVIHVLLDTVVQLDTQCSYMIEHRAVRVLPHTKSAHTALKDATEDGPMRSETL